MTYTGFVHRRLVDVGLGLVALSCSLQMPTEREVFGTGGSFGYSHDSIAGTNGVMPTAMGGGPSANDAAGAGTSMTLDRSGNGGRRTSGNSSAMVSAGGAQKPTSAAVGDNSAQGGKRAGGTGFTGGVTAASSATGDANLVAHFAFDETNGEVATNLTDGTRSGRYVGNCDHPTGRIGGAVSIRNLNGNSSDWVELPQRLFAGLDEVTLSIWVRDLSTTRAGGRLFDFAAGTDTELYFSPSQASPTTGSTVSHLSATHRGVLFADLWTTDARISTGLYSDWHHVAIAWSAANITLYIDGRSVGTKSNPGVLPGDLGTTTTNWLGRTLNDEFLALYAEIDDLRIFGRALDATEVAELWQLP